MNNPLYLPILVAALLLAGCSFVSDYLRPAAPVPAQWPTQAAPAPGAAVPAAPTSDDWQAYFADPQLQKLISAALEHNRDLKIAVARVDEARALAGIARADRFPTVDLAVQQQASHVPADLSTTGASLTSRRFDANLGVAAFELDFWGRVKSLDDAARANFLASDYAQRAFRLGLIADVAAAWYSLEELDARTALAEATAKSRTETRDLIGKRRDVGLAGDLDYLAADGVWQAARAEVANLSRQRAAAENALRLLAGSEAGIAQRAVASVPAFAAPPDITVGLPAEVLLRRPDVLAAEQRLIAANANIGAARAAFLPKIVLTAAAGTASRALTGLFEGGSGAWSFVPLLKWPLFDAGRSAGNLDLATARQNIAVADYEMVLQQAFREVADLLAARQFYAAQAEALAAAEQVQEKRLAHVEARYRAGVSSYLELLDAQREQFAAQQSALAARRAVAATAASFFKAAGGG